MNTACFQLSDRMMTRLYKHISIAGIPLLVLGVCLAGIGGLEGNTYYTGAAFLGIGMIFGGLFSYLDKNCLALVMALAISGLCAAAFLAVNAYL